MENYLGRLLDNRYEILEVIGTGGMAVVYKALDHRLNRLVAVKILKDEFSRNQEFRRRFHAESQAVAMLSHPNIVSVYDVSRSGDVDYIVMELIEGITLKQYLEKKGCLNAIFSANGFPLQIENRLSENRANFLHQRHDIFFGPAAVHSLQHFIVGMLHWNIKIWYDLWQSGHAFHQLIVNFIRIHIQDTDPAETFDFMYFFQQIQKTASSIQIDSVFRRILGIQDNFLHPFGRKFFGLFNKFLHRK